MASTVQILLNTLDYTPLVPYDSIHVNNNIVMTSDTMDFNIELTPGVDTVVDTSNSSSIVAGRPKCGQEIVWQNPNVIVTAPDGSQKPYREFAGVIVEVDESSDGVRLVYEVHAKSYVHWLDRHLVAAWYGQDAPENIIKSLIQRFAPTFTTYNVQSTKTSVIPQYFDYRKVSDAIKSIADQLEYGFYIDYYKDVHFYAAETFTSPLPNNKLDVDNDLQNYFDLFIKENGEQQYNKIFIKGFKTRSDNFMMLTFPGDGQTTQWSLGYRVSSLTGDFKCAVYASLADYQSDASFQQGGDPTNGALLTVKRDIIDGAPDRGADADTAYIHYTQHIVRVPDYNGAPLPSGYVLACRFYYLRDMVFLAQDPQAASQTGAVEGGTDGIYEYAHSDKSLTNSTLDAVKAKGQLMLIKYKFPQVQGTFSTYFNATDTSGWRAGQYFTIKTTKRFDGLDEIVFVQRVLKSIVKNDDGGLVTQYDIEFADSPYLV